MRSIVGGAALLAAVATPLAAQRDTAPTGDSARRPPVAACDSIVRAATVDSVPTIVSAYLVRTDGGVTSREYADLLLQEFAQRFRVPQPLRLQVLAPGPASLRALAPERRSATAPRELHLLGVYDFDASADGGAGRIRVRVTSLAPSFDSAVVATLDAIGRDHAMPLSPGAASSDTTPLRLSITSGAPEPGRARAIFRTMLPRVAAADAAAARDNPEPEYPVVERALGMDGYVLFQLVVSDEGRVEPGTVEILQATSGAFMHAAISMLDSLRFTPARVGPCPVPQVYRMPVRFVAKPATEIEPTPRTPPAR